MKKHYKLLSLVLIMSIMLSGVCAFAQEQENNASHEVAANKMLISINPDATIEDVENLVETENLDMESFNAQFDISGETITCGYVVNNQENFLNLWNDFTEKQTALLTEAIEVNANNEEVISNLTTLLNAFENDEVKVSSVICREAAINEIENATVVDNIMELPVEIETTDMLESSFQSTSATADTSSASTMAATNTWVPTSGTAYAWPSGENSSATYMQLDYRWSSASRMTTLTGNSNSTLEGEILFYNYDGSAIATRWYNQTYTTNQPSPYLDTQFLDGSDEINFTVGCSDASSMTAGKLYYWYAYGNRTSSNACKAKVNFQRGHRLIAENYGDPWNVFADQTSTVIAFNEWNTGTSGSKSW